MKLPKRNLTTKLHYRKYLYKVNLYTELGFIFRAEFDRGVRLSYAAAKLDEIRTTLKDRGEYLILRFRTSFALSEVQFKEAEKLYNLLIDSDDYKIRIERGYNLWIYSNTKSLIDDIIKVSPETVISYWDVEDNIAKFLSNNTNTVIVDKPTDYEYKVYLTQGSNGPAIARWLENNTDKSRVGEKTLNDLKNNWIYGQYCYVKDSKVLLMYQLVSGGGNPRVEKLVYSGDIDKYNYGTE